MIDPRTWKMWQTIKRNRRILKDKKKRIDPEEASRLETDNMILIEELKKEVKKNEH